MHVCGSSLSSIPLHLHVSDYYTFYLYHKGMEQIAASKSEQKAIVQSVLLFTDGLANEGITETDDIIDQIKKFEEMPQQSSGLKVRQPKYYLTNSKYIVHANNLVCVKPSSEKSSYIFIPPNLSMMKCVLFISVSGLHLHIWFWVRP